MGRKEKVGFNRRFSLRLLLVVAIGLLGNGLPASPGVLGADAKSFCKFKRDPSSQPVNQTRRRGIKSIAKVKTRDVDANGQTESRQFNALTSNVPAKGKEHAPITILGFSDFQCPFCARVSPTPEWLLQHYPGQVKWVFKHFPLLFRPDAPLAHEAALAAGAQGKFWEMHDLLFQHQRKLRPEQMVEYAKRFGMDVASFEQALKTHLYREIVRQDILDGMNRDVRGVPTYFINDKRLDGIPTISVLQSLIEEELVRQPSKEQQARVSGTRLGVVE